MIKKTITYTDYNGVERTEDFYFNLSEAEIIDMEQTTPGGMAAMLQGLLDAKNVPELAKVFRDIVRKAYGVKTPDGRRFMKSEEILRDFVETEAYSQIYMMLATDLDYAGEFMKGIFPADTVAKLDKAQNNAKAPAANAASRQAFSLA